MYFAAVRGYGFCSDIKICISNVQYTIGNTLCNVKYMYIFFYFLYQIISMSIFHIRLRPELFLAQTLNWFPQHFSFSGFNSFLVALILLQSKTFLCLEIDLISFTITFIAITPGIIVFRFYGVNSLYTLIKNNKLLNLWLMQCALLCTLSFKSNILRYVKDKQDRQRTYKRNVEAPSRHRCYSGIAIRIT